MSDQIVLTDSGDAEVQETDGTVVTRQHLVVDGDHDKEVTLYSPTAGASSEAPASSGIPSAVMQHGQRREAFAKQFETPMANHVERTDDTEEP